MTRGETPVPARRRARGGVAFVALAAALIAALIGAVAPAVGNWAVGPPAPGCEVLDRPTSFAPMVVDVLTVPVIIHYMTINTRRGDGDARDAERINESVLATTAALEALFAAPRPNLRPERRGVNDVWAKYRIRLWLQRVERCVFDPEEAGGSVLPAPAFDDLRRFRALNARFNTPGFGGINVYQWPRIQGVGAYASPTRENGPFPGAGAVWYHVVSLVESEPIPSGWQTNVLLMAHEIGHYLTLTHTCTKGPPLAGQPFPPGHPDRDLPSCPRPGSDPRASLMSDRQDGIELTQCEEKKARAAARTLLRITITNPEEALCPEPAH